MGYSDAKYLARPLVPVASGVIDMGTSTGAGTASNSLASPTASPLAAYARRTQIGNIQVDVIAAPNAAATVLKMNFLNGTNTFGSVTLTTATALQVLSGVITAANAIFAAGGQPTYNVIGTFTASGGTAGKYAVQFEQQELPA